MIRKQQHRAVLLLHVLLLVVALVGACDSMDGGRLPEPEAPGLVVYTIYYPDSAKIAIAPFDAPLNHEVIVSRAGYNERPQFSPDKTKLLFVDTDLSSEDGFGLFLYNSEEEVASVIVDASLPDEQLRVPFPTSSRLVWRSDGEGFYHGRTGGVAVREETHYYTLSDSTSVLINPLVFPIGLVSPDTLLTIASGIDDQLPRSLYQLDLVKNTLIPVDNYHLRFEEGPARIRRTVISPSWNADDRRIAFAIRDSTVEQFGSKIAVTDFSGSFFREYTSGDFADRNPRWIQGGKVLFDRIERNDLTRNDRYRIMLLDINTGDVQEYLTPEMFPMAVGVGGPDY